jgi:hypothetical protein
MPFKSKAQMRWMFANDPKMAAKWEDATDKQKGGIKALPNKVKKSSSKKKGK